MCRPTVSVKMRDHTCPSSPQDKATISTRDLNGKNWSSKSVKIKSYVLLPFQIGLLLFILGVAFPLLLFLFVCHDIIMFAFVGNTYLYNQSWEDPAIDQKVFGLTEEDHVITIASAGDNVLDYMIEGAEVTAVDFNICQIALTEIKIACIQKLTYDEFYAIFAKNDCDLLRSKYDIIRPCLRPEVQAMWDNQLPYLKTFMYSGSSGFLAWILVQIVLPLCGLAFIKDAVKRRMPKDKFLALVDQHKVQVKAVSWIADNILLSAMCLFAGVPKRQLELGLHKKTPMGDVVDHVLFQTDLCGDNYFYGGYLLGEYTETSCPRYLRRENFKALQKAVEKDRLHLVHGTFVEACKQVEGRPFTISSLLDHMDWMSIPMISEELALLISKMDLKRGRIFWRSFSDSVHSPPLELLNPVRVDDTGDMVGMYFSTWISHLKDVNFDLLERNDKLCGEATGVLGQLWTGLKIVSFPFLASLYKLSANAKSQQGKAMEAFYAHQKGDYDSFRENMLHARPWLMHSFPINSEGKMIWVDVGGGTARNLEYLPPKIVREKFSKIVILDVSPSLLEMAKERVEAMGLSDIVTLVEEDFTATKAFDSLPAKGSVDVVTMSYSLSMIPDKVQAVKHAIELLKPNGKGRFMIADFFALPTIMVRDQNPCRGLGRIARSFESVFHKKWFANDHVYLLEESIVDLLDGDKVRKIWDVRERGSVPFLPFLRPHHGLCIAQTK